MPRTLAVKETKLTRLASGHGGWVYCESCGENIGYLCYVTYKSFSFSYKCKCGSCGSMRLVFGHDIPENTSDKALVTIKNRLCCPNDNSPLFTILYKKLESCKYEVVCAKCGEKYAEEVQI